MSELSPAAQAVLDAWEFKLEPMVTCLTHDPEREALAAALRAAADQADPKRNIKDISYQHQLYVDGWKDALDKVLDIADELKAQ